MREKGERVRVFADGRKGGRRILIQTESVYNDELLLFLRNFDKLLWSEKKLQFQNPKSEGFVWTCIRVPKNTKHHYITLLEAHSILSVPKLRIWYYSSSVVARPWVWSDATVRFWCTAIGPCSQSLPKTNFQEYIKVDTFIRWLKSIKSKSLDNVYDYSFISNRIDCCHTDNHYWRFKRIFPDLALLSKFCKFYGINQIKFNV